VWLIERTMRSIKSLTYSFLAFSSIAYTASAQVAEETTEVAPTIEQIQSVYPSASSAGTVGKVGRYSQVTVQENQFYLNAKDTAQLMQDWGNLPATYAGSVVADDQSYAIIFTFDNIGYVKDDEKGDLDADELLKAIKEGEVEANKQRKAAGIDTLTTKGWTTKPNYNAGTNNLEWALLFEAGDGTQSVNHNVKILGRRGVTDATLICDPSQLDALQPTLKATLAGFEYTAGNTYAEFKEGDKVSEYGLKALLVGGGIFAASKLGILALLGKYFKVIVVAVIGFFAMLKYKIFGKKSEN